MKGYFPSPSLSQVKKHASLEGPLCQFVEVQQPMWGMADLSGSEARLNNKGFNFELTMSCAACQEPQYRLRCCQKQKNLKR